MNKDILSAIFPFLKWWPLVNKQSVKYDFIAGITGAIIVLPQGVAFALIAGMPPIYGLYTAMITPIIAALFGSSWHLISGPTTAISIVVFSAISDFAEPFSEPFIELALIVTLIAGVIQFVLGLARMGTLVNFVSHSVVVGFTAGAALLISVKQLKYVFGIPIENGASFYQILLTIGKNIDETNLYIFSTAIVTLLVAIIIKKVLPKWPNMLIAMIAGSLFSLVINGPTYGVELVGALPSNLPPFRIPEVSFEKVQMLATNAFAIALLGLIEAVAIARSIATRSHQRIDGNQEFIGQGLSNMVGSIFSCYAGSGSFTRSGVNYQAGARTPMAAIFAAVILMLVLLLIAPLTGYLPIPAMGGIILLVGYNLIDFHHIKQIMKASNRETAVMAITFLATLFLHLEYAIYLGVFFSLILYLQQTSTPLVTVLAPNPDHYRKKFENVTRLGLVECPQLKIIRIDGSLFFGSVEHVGKAFARFGKGEQKNVLLICSGIDIIDVAGAEMLVAEAQRLRTAGGQLYLSSLKFKARNFLKRGGYLEKIGDENIFPTKELAIENIYKQLDKSICENCEARIFLECKKDKVLEH